MYHVLCTVHGENIAMAVLKSKLELVRSRRFQYRVPCTARGENIATAVDSLGPQELIV